MSFTSVLSILTNPRATIKPKVDPLRFTITYDPRSRRNDDGFGSSYIAHFANTPQETVAEDTERQPDRTGHCGFVSIHEFDDTLVPTDFANVPDHISAAVARDGLGNLADELGEVWDDEEDTRGESLLDDLREGDASLQSPTEMNDMLDFGFGGVHSPLTHEETALSPVMSNSLKPPKRRQSHRRTDSAYDGSDYGPDSDYEEQTEGFPPLLRKQVREIEKLSRSAQNPDDALSEGGGVIKRTIAALRDLGPPQSNIEYGVTRMVTGYTSMATHRTHKQRDIFTQSHSLLYSNSAMYLPEELIDELIASIEALVTTVPVQQPNLNPLLSLQILASQTSDLTQTLQNLTDLLQENKVAANAATRKLKSVKDMVAEMRVEEDLVENSIMLISAYDFDRRLRERQAAKTCREVVSGFAERWGLECPAEVGVAV
ncbi:uncharacterized protein AB675_2437 [Cyphellophora attinorum]|uniref:Uncharacterized protein n=1 Tax=Cyphellophora attinorum TaxID=1664694 RepID=A0A0N1HB56_9EURO|nr:uncharacterized protein AB675_2437 [Phialophora attinorum]KPI45364.1 hypothetical protein AB675_2437 [Phialophora attinorum]